MSFSVKRVLHPVGHGAFFTEQFFADRRNVFNVVYDCGVVYDSLSNLYEEIDNTFAKSTKSFVDYIFISHLDEDHVNGIVEGIVRVMQGAPERMKGEDGLPIPPYAVYNIGGDQPENLLDFVQILQEELVRAGVLPSDFDFEAHKELVPMQPGDVPTTYADATALERDFGFTPKITLREGLRKFAEWYKEYYK